MYKHVFNLCKLISKESSVSANLFRESKNVSCVLLPRMFHLTSIGYGVGDRRDLRSLREGVSVKDEGTAGESSIPIDQLKEDDIFPTPNTPNTLFNGVPFKELHIFNIKATRNNTIMTLTDFLGNVKIIRSCGVEGFKHAKKGTNIAAQTTAITLGSQATVLGVKTARVRVAGLGPGRMAAIKGLQLGGIQIVSITDNTHVSWSPPRPRKQRRV